MPVSVPRVLAALSSVASVAVPVQTQDAECAAVQVKKYADIFTFPLSSPQ